MGPGMLERGGTESLMAGLGVEVQDRDTDIQLASAEEPAAEVENWV